jgi:hypothetical protein
LQFSSSSRFLHPFAFRFLLLFIFIHLSSLFLHDREGERYTGFAAFAREHGQRVGGATSNDGGALMAGIWKRCGAWVE